MTVQKPLPKAILYKLEAAEQKALNGLEEKYIKTGDEMVKAQRAASVAMKNELKEKKARTKTTQKLINKGFKAEFLAFNAADELRNYKEQLRKKYSN